ncbi:hypothetical protein DTL42_17135 [Bremerella cremea]|uniref:Uncharacterized protein n=1 Tax=Bremerella cremea TaxID=1031537 RepID=A0A368KN72_9BACT|nr:hypothetical protein [Bremerella cremea]RCS44646.1 hypothetical protein DTL42_17135 [Bremerella cremea]
MKQLILSFALVLVASPVFAQGYPPPYYPPYGAYTNTATAAQGALQGMADVASAAGSYNEQTSEADINEAKATSLNIANDQQYANTYYQMRAQHDAYEAKQHPAPTEEQVVQMARAGIPKSLSANSYNPVTAKLAWPDLLQYPEFAKDRTEIETLLKKQASHGSLGGQDSQQFTSTIDDMLVILKRGIKKVPPQQFMQSYNFLNSLLYSTCKTELP